MAVNGWTMKVIELLLEEFDGRAKFGQFKRRLYQEYLVKGGIARVLDRLYDSNRFLVFEKYEQVKYVSVAWEDAIICCGYRKRGWDTCVKGNCFKFHICKFFITGNCVYGSRCLFGHDLENEANWNVSDNLGLSSFSAEQIRTIIFRSHPAVCVNYNTGGCDDDDCPDLHICSRFILQKCTAGARCNFGHSFRTTEHNQWILETFYVEDLNDEELKRRVLVTNISNTDISLRSQMTPATSSLSVFNGATAASSTSSLSSIDTEDYIFSVFSFLLKNLGGRVKFNTFLTKRGDLLQGLKKVDIIEWLEDNSDRFLLHKSDGDVKFVSVHNRRARVCFRYNNPGDSMCDNQFCKFFHICRDLLTDTCIRTRCHLNHDFSSWPNAKICSDLNFQQFSDKEICKIILCSHPVVCVKYNESGCQLNECPDLHVCSKNILNQCARGDGCRFGHTIKNSGEHNSYVLKAFGMDTWQEHVLRKLVIVSKRQHPEPLRHVPAVHQVLDIRQSGKNEYTRHRTKSIGVKDTDPGEYEYLCEIYTWTGVCPKTPNCPRYHSPDRLPYLWLIRNHEDGQWRRVHSSVNTDFERSFCCLADVRSFQFNVPRVQNVDFRAMSAKVGVRQSVKLRRLSTPSYVTAAPGTPLNFYTQWVWYWQEHDGSSYTPFYPETLQYTLEEKYLKGQQKYYFEFGDLRLMVNTQSSPIVQTNLDTQRTTSVIRRPVFMSGTSKIPTMSSSLLSEVPEPVLHQVPDHWSAMDRFQDFELVELPASVSEYTAVQRQFFSTMNRRMHKTVHIFRVQNPGLWDKYCSARRAITPRGQRPEEVEERQLFHGTPTLQAARGICANSFDFRRSGENVGARWGKGAYFSTRAKFSHSYTRVHTPVTGDPLRFMFLGRILVGQYTLGHPSYTKPPERDRLKLYDSCVNNVSNPTIFVIFDLAQSYPEYLIQYTDASDSRPQPQLRPPTSSPPLRATMTVTSPPPSVIFDLAQSYPEYLIQYTDVSGSRRQPQLRPPTSSPPPVATMTVTSPPPSVSKTAVQSYSSTVQTPNKSPKVTPTPAPTANPFAPSAPPNPFAPSAPRAVTPVSPGFCLPFPVPQPTSSPPPVATMTVTSPPPSVIFDLAQSYPEYLIQYTDVSGSRRQPQPCPPTSSPPPVATMTVTSPPPSVSKTAVQSYSSTVQTPNKSPKVTPTPVSPGCCLPFPMRRAQSVVSLSSTTPQSSSSPPNMGVSNDPSPSSSSGARSPSAKEQKCSAFKRKKKHKCVII